MFNKMLVFKSFKISNKYYKTIIKTGLRIFEVKTLV